MHIVLLVLITAGEQLYVHLQADPTQRLQTANWNCAQEGSKSTITLVNDNKVFDIVIQALHEVLTDMGVRHDVVKEADPTDEHTIYLICTTGEQNAVMPKRYISYNFEQLTHEQYQSLEIWSGKNAYFLERFRKAEMVMDYSLENVRALQRLNITAIHVPFGFARFFDGGLAHEKRPINSLFLAYMNEFRQEKLQPLMSLVPHQHNQSWVTVKDSCAGSGWVVLSLQCWGWSTLLAAFDLTKIGRNVHYFRGRTILEVHRIIPLVANRVWVVSERSNDSWYDDAYSELVTFVNDKDELAHVVAQILALPQAEYDATVEKRHQLLVRERAYLQYVQDSGAFSQWSPCNERKLQRQRKL
jgi:hypothetical protein